MEFRDGLIVCQTLIELWLRLGLNSKAYAIAPISSHKESILWPNCKNNSKETGGAQGMILLYVIVEYF